MPMIPFVEKFPEVGARETRFVTVTNREELPDGEYGFFELYCNEPRHYRMFRESVEQGPGHESDRSRTEARRKTSEYPDVAAVSGTETFGAAGSIPRWPAAPLPPPATRQGAAARRTSHTPPRAHAGLPRP